VKIREISVWFPRFACFAASRENLEHSQKRRGQPHSKTLPRYLIP